MHDATLATPAIDDAPLLLRRIERRKGNVPPAAILDIARAASAGADFTVLRAAVDALLRRLDAADDLEIVSRPAGIFGEYATGRRGDDEERPYRTALLSLEPLAGSCGCPDFTRNALGACKHVLAVASDVHGRALDDVEGGRGAPLGRTLWWHPIRPLAGAGDVLAQVRLAGSSLPAHERLLEWFEPSNGDEQRAPRAAALEGDARRAFVEELLAALAGERATDPALEAVLHDERARPATRSPGDDDDDARRLDEQLARLKLPLYAYQREGARRFLESGRLLLADDMGLGKTAQAAAICHALSLSRDVARGLLIVPAPLKRQWARELERFTSLSAVVVEGTPEERRRCYQGHGEGLLIINYEQLLRDFADIARTQPDIVVLDEAQRIKNWTTRTAAYVKQLRPRYRLVLTGTPLENRLEELASIFDWLDDRALEPKWRLVPWHSHAGESGRGGARNLDTLRTRMAPSLLRRTRGEVLGDLPPRTDTTVPVTLTDAQRDVHDALNRPIARLVHTHRHRPLTPAEFVRLMSLLAKQRMACSGVPLLEFDATWPSLAKIARPTRALLDGLHAPKLGELRSIVEGVALEQRRKLVVFSQWRRMLQLAEWAVRDLLDDHGLRAVFFTGRERGRARERSIEALHDDPSTRIMFLTDAGGVGLNLQRAATCCVNLELPWNPALREQRIGRIHRLGQPEPVDVYDLVATEGIESRIASLVDNKQAFFSALFDGESDEVRFEESSRFFAQLERIIEPAAAPPSSPAIDDVEEALDVDEGLETDAGLERDAGLAVDEQGRAAETGHAPAPADGTARDDVVSPSVQQLFAGVRVTRTERGGVVVEAEPAAAAGLLALFEGMASVLRPLTTTVPSPVSVEPRGSAHGTHA